MQLARHISPYGILHGIICTYLLQSQPVAESVEMHGGRRQKNRMHMICDAVLEQDEYFVCIQG